MIEKNNLLCGVDEVGRGPLAGPVVAAAVILDSTYHIEGLKDSKLLSAKKREALYQLITTHSLAWAVGSASVEEIDSINILQASLLAMKRAVESLVIVPNKVLIDGNRCPFLSIESEAIVGGDALIPAISAASIIAKVTRDAILDKLHIQYPEYGFNAHSGYGTAQHLKALNVHGPCIHHRRTFSPVKKSLERVRFK